MTRAEMIKYIILNDRYYTGVFHAKDSDTDLQLVVERIKKSKLFIESGKKAKIVKG